MATKKLKIKRGDQVIVLTGKDRGKRGEVVKVMPKEDRLVVAGVNQVRRHTRPSPRGPGGVETKEAPIHVSNVAHIDPAQDRPTRVGYKFLGDGRKVRFAKRSGEIIDH